MPGCNCRCELTSRFDLHLKSQTVRGCCKPLTTSHNQAERALSVFSLVALQSGSYTLHTRQLAGCGGMRVAGMHVCGVYKKMQVAADCAPQLPDGVPTEKDGAQVCDCACVLTLPAQVQCQHQCPCIQGYGPAGCRLEQGVSGPAQRRAGGAQQKHVQARHPARHPAWFLINL